MKRNSFLYVIAMLMVFCLPVCVFADAEEVAEPEAAEAVIEAVSEEVPEVPEEEIPEAIEEPSEEEAVEITEDAADEEADSVDEAVDEEIVEPEPAEEQKEVDTVEAEAEVSDEEEYAPSKFEIAVSRCDGTGVADISDLGIKVKEADELAAWLSCSYDEFSFIEENGCIVAIVFDEDVEEEEDDEIVITLYLDAEPDASSTYGAPAVETEEAALAEAEPVAEPEADSPVIAPVKTSPVEDGAAEVEGFLAVTTLFNLLGIAVIRLLLAV